jgi:branched-chain amino acid transport system ATP-binding protein
MLSLKNIKVNYGAIKALHDVSLEVREGEIVTLLGANGAGKTTTLRAISALVPTAGGEIGFMGNSLNSPPLRAHEIVKLGIAHSPEGRKIFSNLSVEENLQMGAFIRGNSAHDKKEISEDRELIFTLFPRLKERLKQIGGTLSGGEQQMLAISRALMQRPKLLMLDEPSLGIAPVLVGAIFRALIEINKKGTTLLLVEQNAAAALSIAHRAYVLETGRTTLSGLAKELANDPKVKAAYLGAH